MSAVPASIKAPLEPQVNLVPPEVAGRKARSRRVGAIGIGFVLLLTLAGGAVYWADGVKGSAEDDLTKAMDEKERLTTEVASYDYVTQAQVAYASAMASRQFAGATEIAWEPMVRSIQARVPEIASFESFVWNPTTIDQTAAVEISPFATPDVGSISFSGQLSTVVLAADLEERLNTVPGLGRARVYTVVAVSTNGRHYFSFTATVRINYAALSGHFNPAWISQRNESQATVALAARVVKATAVRDAAQVEVGALVPGAAERLAAAQANLQDYSDWFDQLKALSAVVAKDQVPIVQAQEDVDAGDEAAVTVLETAIAKRDADRAVLDALTLDLRRVLKALDQVDVANARIASAQAAVVVAQKSVDDAKAAVAAGTGGAVDLLATAERSLKVTTRALEDAKTYLPALTEAADTARTTLATSLASAATAAPVPEAVAAPIVAPSTTGGVSP